MGALIFCFVCLYDILDDFQKRAVRDSVSLFDDDRIRSPFARVGLKHIIGHFFLLGKILL